MPKNSPRLVLLSQVVYIIPGIGHNYLLLSCCYLGYVLIGGQNLVND